jgi:hypothetical protein
MLAAKDRSQQGPAPARRPVGSPQTLRPSTNFGDIRKNAPFIFSTLRTLFLARKPQTSRLHPVAHSFASAKNITPAFPFTSALFLCSFAQERKSTPLLSFACARLCGYAGVCAEPKRNTAAQVGLSEPDSAVGRGFPFYADRPSGLARQARINGSGLVAPHAIGNRMNTYTKCSANPRGMRTFKIIGLKLSCNEHLQKNGGGEVLLLPSGHPRREVGGLTTVEPKSALRLL